MLLTPKQKTRDINKTSSEDNDFTAKQALQKEPQIPWTAPTKISTEYSWMLMGGIFWFFTAAMIATAARSCSSWRASTALAMMLRNKSIKIGREHP